MSIITSISYSEPKVLPGAISPSSSGAPTGRLLLDGLLFNLADSMEQCLGALERSGQQAYPQQQVEVADGDGTAPPQHWCNATWDSVLCWPATPANSSITLPCPPLKGLDPTKSISKFCHASGQWMGRTEGDFSRSHGWTNFTMCFTTEVISIMKNLGNNGTLGIAQDVAKNARKLEFVGLGLSFFALTIGILIYSCFRRLRVFRNLLHLQLMLAILMVVIIRLVLYIDLIFTDQLGHVQVEQTEGKTINTMVVICETMFFLLEYFKSVAFWWMFLEGFYLHNQLVFTVFNTYPRLWPYLLAGYGFPLAHTILWLAVIVYKKQGKLERCLGSYYLEPEFWILDGPRMFQLVLNTLFLSNVIRVLWAKVRDTHASTSDARMKKSVKAALMLIPLLGVPNLMQTIPFSPTQENITYFAIWTYLASFTYMYQGFIVAVIYCFINREVRTVLKSCYQRYRLQHSNTMELRRGSRGLSSPRDQDATTAKLGGTTTTTATRSAGERDGHENLTLLITRRGELDGGGKRLVWGNGVVANGSIGICPHCSNITTNGHAPIIAFVDEGVDENCNRTSEVQPLNESPKRCIHCERVPTMNNNGGQFTGNGDIDAPKRTPVVTFLDNPD